MPAPTGQASYDVAAVRRHFPVLSDGVAHFDGAAGTLVPDVVAEAVAAALTDRTRLVAVTGASNLLGTRPDLPAIAAGVHAAGPALLYIDGVHLTPHTAVDVAALGADFFTCSPYKFLGPHLGVLAAAPDLLEALRPDKLLPSPDEAPERFELGTLPYELLAGVTATVDFLAGLAGQDSGSRRVRLLSSIAEIERYEQGLLSRLESGLHRIGSAIRHATPPGGRPRSCSRYGEWRPPTSRGHSPRPE